MGNVENHFCLFIPESPKSSKFHRSSLLPLKTLPRECGYGWVTHLWHLKWCPSSPFPNFNYYLTNTLNRLLQWQITFSQNSALEKRNDVGIVIAFECKGRVRLIFLKSTLLSYFPWQKTSQASYWSLWIIPVRKPITIKGFRTVLFFLLHHKPLALKLPLWPSTSRTIYLVCYFMWLCFPLPFQGNGLDKTPRFKAIRFLFFSSANSRSSR